MSRFMDIHEFPILNDPSKGLQQSGGDEHQPVAGNKDFVAKNDGFLGW